MKRVDMLARPASDYRDVSMWFDTLVEPVVPRPGLEHDLDVDVAIVGAGFTGLWTAYYLARADPRLRVAVLEKEVAGFGASGRNGGWCSAGFALTPERLARQFGVSAMHAVRAALKDSVEEVGAVAAAEAIACDYTRGGTVVLARGEAQLTRARDKVARARALGIGEDDLRLLGASEAAERCVATDVLGGTYTPHCATLNPAKLARGLAGAVERLGVQLYEGTGVVDVVPRTDGRAPGPLARTEKATVRASVVVRATEAYSTEWSTYHRSLVPIYSLMIATEPLDRAVLDAVGLRSREAFSDQRHMVIYGQRTADGRIAFGGRGAPYHFGSAIKSRYDRDRRVHDQLRATLVELFPALQEARITHGWGGPLGVARDWAPSVSYSRKQGIASASGYVGQGVAAANLAGRTLSDLIMSNSSSLVTLPWVGYEARRWEREPLRYLGVNAGLQLTAAADAMERRRGQPSKIGKRIGRYVGH